MNCPDPPSSLAGRASEVSALLKVLSHADRLKVAIELLHGEAKVGDLAARTKVAQPSRSSELARFKAHRLVETRRESKAVYHALRDELLVHLVYALADAAAAIAAPTSVRASSRKQNTGAPRRHRS
jgi:DNA-binding transcriptional ArsR family regulator